MAITLNPLEIIKMFRDRGVADRSQVASYISAIATDIREAAELWCETVDALKRGDQIGDTKRRRRMIGCMYIEDHYRNASRVIGGRLGQELRDRLFEALGGYLRTRGELERIPAVVQRFLATGEGPSEVEKMEVLSESLLIYAAQLRNLAVEISTTS
jgi:hypothetical protein